MTQTPSLSQYLESTEDNCMSMVYFTKNKNGFKEIFPTMEDHKKMLVEVNDKRPRDQKTLERLKREN